MGLLDTAQRALMPDPQGMDGLLSPDDIRGARSRGLLDMGLSLLANSQGAPGQNAPGVLPAIAGGLQAARTGYEQGTMGTVQNRAQLAELQQKQQQQAARQKLVQQLQTQYPNFASMTPDAQRQAIRAIYGQLIANGDFSAAATMGTVIPGLEKDTPQETYGWENHGGESWLVNKRTGEVLKKEKMTPTPKTASETSADRNFSAGQVNKILDDYRADTKEFTQVMSGWDVLQGATKNPSLATPFAITDAYARITNPGGIVRPTTMEMIDNMGSVGQRMRKYWEHNANGALPPDIMRDFQRTLYNIVKEHKKHYDDVYTRTVRRGRDSGVDVTPYLTQFNIEDPTAPTGAPTAGAGNAGAVRQFLKPR